MPFSQSTGITHPETPAQHFAYWLPGELEYSAQKAGYREKVRRARLSIDDPHSMYTFLGNEWHQHRLLKQLGAHYVPHHGKSAQLQAAKFAAGLFDKVAVIDWLNSSYPPNTESYMAAARWTGHEHGKHFYYHGDRVALGKDFSDFGDTIEETPFAVGIKAIMEAVTEVADNRDELRVVQDGIRRYRNLVDDVAIMAAHYYISYAHECLSPEEYELPISELAPPTQS